MEITLTMNLPIWFSSGETMTITLYVTPLDSSCSVVLGYNWLICYNPLIDWVLGSITFCSPEIRQSSTPPTSVQDVPLRTSTSDEPLSSTLPSGAPHILMINAAAFMRASRLPGAVSFRIFISNPSKSDNSATFKNSVDLSNISEEYQDFANVFSKGKANTLVPYQPYNLKINLEEGTEPPLGPIYSLSQSELRALWKFLDEHLALGFIHP